MIKTKKTVADRRELEGYFKLIGIDDPTFYADEEVEGEPALARMLLLRGLSRCVQDRWMDEPDSLESELVSKALKKAASVLSREELLAIGRALQRLAIWNAACLLDDSSSGIEDLQGAIAPHVAWKVFQVDEHEKPKKRIGGLHEDLTDLFPPIAEVPKVSSSSKGGPKGKKR